MASAGRGWQSGLRALTCAGLLLTPSAGHAQSEVRKTPPRPPAQVEVNKGVQNPVAVTPAAEPAAPAWSAEVSERGVAAIAAEIGGDEARTRFSIVLSEMCWRNSGWRRRSMRRCVGREPMKTF